MRTLIKTGKLAKIAGVLPSTIRYYTKMGILQSAGHTPGGARLYDMKDSLKRLRIAQRIKEQRWSLSKIKDNIEKDSHITVEEIGCL